MINQIDIQNFQSHKNTSLELHEGVNVIIGSSDSGKTAILRALRWLIKNRPLGGSFRSNWGGDTFVDVGLEYDHAIKRFKNKKRNQYNLNTGGGDDSEFKAFNKDVPDEVKQLLNMSDINSHKQHDPPFLLFQSAGENAKYINNIVDLEVIDKSLYNIASQLRTEKTEWSAKVSEAEELEEEVKKYDWLDNAKKDIVRLDKLQTNIENKKDEAHYIKVLLSDIKSVKGRKKEYRDIIKREKEVNKMNDILVELKKLNNKKFELESIINKIADTRVIIMTMKFKIKKLKKEFNIIMPNICPLCKQEVK